MASKEDLAKIGSEGFDAIDKAFGRNPYLYHRTEAPLEFIPISLYPVYRKTEISHVPNSLLSPPLVGPPRSFKVAGPVPMKQQKGAKFVGPVYGPGEEVIDSYKAARVYGGFARVDYGHRF